MDQGDTPYHIMSFSEIKDGGEKEKGGDALNYI